MSLGFTRRHHVVELKFDTSCAGPKLVAANGVHAQPTMNLSVLIFRADSHESWLVSGDNRMM